jgi:DNA helicase-2/ATP-dependent DNA helicase PcrA
LDPSETAILYRGNYDARGLEYVLVEAGIPYQKFGGQEVKEAKHIKDFMSYLRVVINPKDMGAWKRLLMLQKGIGKETSSKICAQIEQHGFSGLRTKGKGAAALQDLYWLLSQPHDIMTTIDHVHQHYRSILDSQKELKTEYEAYPTRVKDIEQLSQQWRLAGNLQDILDAWYTADVFDADAVKGDKLTLSTIHSAKGLEWDNVFIINLTDGRLPSGKSFDCQADMDEEHRLFYVAMTRARKQLLLCYPRMYLDGKSITSARPSRFLHGLEIKPKNS